MLLRGARVSHNYFDIYGTKPFLGRTFLPEEDQYGKDHVVLLTHALWVSQFGADRQIVGRTIRLDGQNYQVVGVLPPGGVYDRWYYQIVKPLAFAPGETTRGYHWFGAYARLKPGITLQQARASMNTLAADYAQKYPDTNKGFGISMDRLSDVLVGPNMRAALYILFAAASMVLLIGCANLGESDGVARCGSGERGGSPCFSRSRAQPASASAADGESAALAAGWRTRNRARVSRYSMASRGNAGEPLPARGQCADGRTRNAFRRGHLSLHWSSFRACTGAAGQQPRLDHAMKDSGRTTTGSGRSRLRNGLVIGEVALAFVLLCGAGLLIRSFFMQETIDPGFDSTNVLTMALATPADQYPEVAQLNAYLRNLRLAVEGVARRRAGGLRNCSAAAGHGLVSHAIGRQEPVAASLSWFIFLQNCRSCLLQGTPHSLTKGTSIRRSRQSGCPACRRNQ